MADSGGQRSEKATPRRKERARKEGNFPSSKEFVASVQFLGFVALMSLYAASGVARAGRLMRMLLQRAFTTEITPANVAHLAIQVVAPELVPLMIGGGALVLLVLAVQMGVTKMGFSTQKLVPDFGRLNPMKRLSSMPSQNLFMTAQAVLLLVLVTAIVYYEIAENLGTFMELPWLPPQTSAARIGGVLSTLLWRAASLFMLVGVIDLLWQRSRYNKQLRMSKQEIREEVKEQESSPQVKMRIRRIQRDLARRHMMQEIATAPSAIRSIPTPRRAWSPKARTTSPSASANAPWIIRSRSSRTRRWPERCTLRSTSARRSPAISTAPWRRFLHIFTGL